MMGSTALLVKSMGPSEITRGCFDSVCIFASPTTDYRSQLEPPHPLSPSSNHLANSSRHSSGLNIASSVASSPATTARIYGLSNPCNIPAQATTSPRHRHPPPSSPQTRTSHHLSPFSRQLSCGSMFSSAATRHTYRVPNRSTIRISTNIVRSWVSCVQP